MYRGRLCTERLWVGGSFHSVLAEKGAQAAVGGDMYVQSLVSHMYVWGEGVRIHFILYFESVHKATVFFSFFHFLTL